MTARRDPSAGRHTREVGVMRRLIAALAVGEVLLLGCCVFQSQYEGPSSRFVSRELLRNVADSLIARPAGQPRSRLPSAASVLAEGSQAATWRELAVATAGLADTPEVQEVSRFVRDADTAGRPIAPSVFRWLLYSSSLPGSDQGYFRPAGASKPF